jgi:hypothetical protein
MQNRFINFEFYFNVEDIYDDVKVELDLIF